MDSWPTTREVEKPKRIIAPDPDLRARTSDLEVLFELMEMLVEQVEILARAAVAIENAVERMARDGVTVKP